MNGDMLTPSETLLMMSLEGRLNQTVGWLVQNIGLHGHSVLSKSLQKSSNEANSVDSLWHMQLFLFEIQLSLKLAQNQ